MLNQQVTIDTQLLRRLTMAASAYYNDLKDCNEVELPTDFLHQLKTDIETAKEQRKNHD